MGETQLLPFQKRRLRPGQKELRPCHFQLLKASGFAVNICIIGIDSDLALSLLLEKSVQVWTSKLQ